MALRGFFLVESLKSAVMTFIEAPIRDDGHIGLTKLCQRSVIGVDCTGKERGEDDVEMHSRLAQCATRCICLSLALSTERYVVPAGEQIERIPRTLTVSQNHEGAHCTGWL